MNPYPASNSRLQAAPLILIIPCSAIAAGMGWGIRGQYGHETGAMIAGALTSLVLILFFIPQTSSLVAARAAALMTVAIGIGGTMTYGQTIGLTQDASLIGNRAALGWGLLGLGIKGGLWIGFAGTFLGMGLGGKVYRPLQVLLLMLGLTCLVFLGIWLINSPYDPASRVLPKLYFSGSWYWQPNQVDLRPRPEVWGGLLAALTGLLLYVRLVRQDSLALRMGLIGILAGGLGFSGGQCVQAFHAWNTELFKTGALSKLTLFGYVNWWNMMEISFGLIFGAVISLGLWWNRGLISVSTDAESVSISPTMEILLVAVHLILLIIAEFLNLPGKAGIISNYVSYGLIMCIIPMVGIIGGRFWPYLIMLPIVAAPICGKEIRALCYGNEPQIELELGWVCFVMLPMGITIVTATWLIAASLRRRDAQTFAAVALLVNTLLYFGLNTSLFNFAWPWNEWTGRTPSQMIFMFCTVVLTALSVIKLRKSLSATS